MRTVGISAFVGLFIYVYYSFNVDSRNLNKRAVLLLLVIASVIYVAFQWEVVFQKISTLLLLNNQWRGISSGFSGRLENIIAGWKLFLESPLIGVGPVQEDAAYTHNGYIKIIAQYGVFGVFWIVLMMTAIWKAWTRKSYPLLAVVSMLSLYYVGQPRHLSFQVFPLVGIFAVFRAVVLKHPDGEKK